MAEHGMKRRKMSHSWLDLEAQVEHDEEEDEAWEIGVYVLEMFQGIY